jgi:hypothetical protein
LNAELPRLRGEVERLTKWVNDLQSGMFINCVYCGYRYGPRKGTPVAMADVLKEHIEKCPQHPMSALKMEMERLKGKWASSNQRCPQCGCGIVPLQDAERIAIAEAVRKETMYTYDGTDYPAHSSHARMHLDELADRIEKGEVKP